jgi:hypothetical protein
MSGAMALASKEPGRGSNGSLMNCESVVVILLVAKTTFRLIAKGTDPFIKIGSSCTSSESFGHEVA